MNTNPLSATCLLTCALGAFLSFPAAAEEPKRPNIVFIVTDDQGYGDLGHTGNPVLKTAHIDKLAAESSSLTDYHVSPTCSPTRASLLTGRWANRTGVWHTVNGRSMLRENEITLGEVLRKTGYATGLFGKWHLGDNFPYRPEDRGFTEVYRHGGGGVGQTPDVWDNSYFDGSYYHNGRVVAAKGFCTDVFFSEAKRFIRECAAKREPFFAYITPNAPHSPYHAPQKYMDLYADQPPKLAAFFGMIHNIDDNVGALRELLRDLAIEDNTLFIFTTDNGTALGESVFTAGMRGKKGSEYDGGHRVPFIAHWPAAGWNRKHVPDILCHAVDIVPTLLDVCGAKQPEGLNLDGRSILSLLDPAGDVADWPRDRMLVTDSQRVRDPIKWKQTAVMSGKWRLVNGTELYDIASDPGQQNNVIAAHPDRTTTMRAFYDAWWAELEPTFSQSTAIYLGHPEHPVVGLTAHDWIQEKLPPWNQQHIREAEGYASRPNKKDRSKSVHQGHWFVKVITPGTYTIRLRRWPVEADRPITTALPAGENVPGGERAFRARPGEAIPVTSAVLRLGGEDLESKPVVPGEKEIVFTARLAAGPQRLAPVFRDDRGNEIGAYFATITHHP
ncbi:MAG: arylsulfatase [Akkermansiaceae bacterium]